MKKWIFIVALTSMYFCLFPQTIDWQWAVGTGAVSSNLSDEGKAIVVDSQGNQYITGFFEYSAYFGTILISSSGGQDIFVAKLDSNGNFIWAKKAGGSDDDIGWSIALDSSNNVYITGCFDATATFGSTTLSSSGSTWDPFIAKLDSNGNWLWAVKGGGTGSEEIGFDIAVDSAANVYVTGRFQGTATFGTIPLTSFGSFDIFVAKLNSSGSWIWAVKAGTTAGDEGYSLDLDSSGNIYVTGFFDGLATFGSISLPSYGSTDDVFVAKLNNSGTWQWAVNAGTTTDETGFDLVVDGSANVYVTGYYDGTGTFGTITLSSVSSSDDIFVAKLNSSGNWIWAATAGGSDTDWGYGIAVNGSSEVFITGGIDGTAYFGSTSISTSGSTWDPFVAKLDASGNWLWAVKGGGTGTEEAGYGIALDSYSNAYVTGRYQGTANFGSYSLTTNGNFDIFAAKYGYTPPVAPSGLTAQVWSSSQINISWTDNSTFETGYRIERKTGAGGTWAEIVSLGANATAYSNIGLTQHTTYYYRVRAINVTVLSPYSNEVNATTPYSTPTAPSGLTPAVISDSQINLSWTDNSTVETGYKVERKTGTGGTWAEIASLGANATSYNNTGLAQHTLYYYRVRAINVEVYSAYSNEASATTLYTTPQSPSGLTVAVISDSQINLSWTDNSTVETGFRVERRTGTGGTWAEIAMVGANVTTYSNTGLAQHTLYYYRVRAINVEVYSAYSNEASATTLYTTPPPPSGLTPMVISDSQINLSWTDNSIVETGYSVERKTGEGGTWAEIASLGANATSYNNTGLAQHTLYYYRVRAVNVVVYSAYSNEANATTLYTTPPAPSELAAEPISPSQIYLSWIDNAAVETGFRIERKIEDTGTWAEIAFVEANVTVYSDTGLEPHTHYYYRVRAVNVNVYSSYSNEANATTSYATPPAPSNLSAVTISSSQIILSWTDNSPNETGFRIEYRIGTAGTWSEIGSVEENLSAYVSDGLASYMTYFYRVRAYNDYGNSEYSNEANAITLLSSPENLSLMHFASNIFIMWDTVSGAQSYYVYRSVDPYAVDWGVPVAHTASTVFMDISSLNKCFYKIKASSIPLSVKSDDPANIIPTDIKNLLHK